MYESLTELIPAIDSVDAYGEWFVDREHKGTPDDPRHFPYVSFGTVMWDFNRRIYAFVEEHPEYGLTRYQDILAKGGIEWDSDSMGAADISWLDGRTITALETPAVAVRGARQFWSSVVLAGNETISRRLATAPAIAASFH